MNEDTKEGRKEGSTT